ncbi:MAG: glycosyltransferase [Sciscionella sp.]
MNLLRVIHVIHSLAPGGAEAVLVDLAEVAEEVNLEIAVMPLVRISDERYVRAVRSRGVPVLGLDLTSRWDPRVFPLALTALRAWRPDIVHTHLKHADIVGAVAARRLDVPMVSTLHIGHDNPGQLYRAKRLLAAAARLSTAARTISVSDAQRRWYLDAFPRADPHRVVTVHNGVLDPRGRSPGEFDRGTLRRSIGVPEDAVLAAQVGLCRPGKGHADLITAMRLLGADSGVHLAIAGDGPLRAELAASARDVAERVHFLGYRSDVPALLEAADLVVQPSEYDALPTTLIQALAAGRPSVATEVGGIPEIVTSDVGILVRAREPAALAAAIRELAADPQRRQRLGGAARQRFESRFHAHAWARSLGELYAETLKETGQRWRDR